MSDKDNEVISTSTHPFPAPSRRPSVSVSFGDEEEHPTKSPTPAVVEKKTTASTQVNSRPSPLQGSESSTRPTKSLVETNADFNSVELPSKFFFYPFKTLELGNVRGKHQAKFSAAAKNESTRMVVEAVSTLMGGVSAMELTIPDFYFVMYQLRLNSTGMVPLMVRAMCSEPNHVLQVAESKKDRKTLLNETLVNRSDLSESVLDLDEVHAFLSSEEALAFEADGLRLDAPRMSDSIELEEQWLGKPEYDEIEFLADLAGSIVGLPEVYSEGPLSLTARIEIVGNMAPSRIATLKKWIELLQSYGVEEEVTTRCKECGAEIKTEVSVSAHSFL